MPIVASREISSEKEELVVIRTSDRINFKRCRRLWGWMSHLKMGLSIREEADYFWFGSGVHFALEDYHGLNVYGHPANAFMAYVDATKRRGSAPATWNEHLDLGLSNMAYYADYWLTYREPLNTWWIDGIPQVEINGYIDLGVKHKGKRVVYGFTLDRMIADNHGQVFVGEYKTAKMFSIFHYDTDEQVTAYCYCASRLYNRPIAGVYYYQFKKQIPALPKILAKGGVSTAPNQATSSALYRKQLIDVYGDLSIVPKANIKCLNDITSDETEDSDKFIRRERIDRNEHQVEMFEQRVMLELEDILNEDLPLYPNQTRDCSWGCPLQVACITLESGGDYEGALSAYARKPTPMDTSWRKYLPAPEDIVMPVEAEIYKGMMEEISSQDNREIIVTPEEAFLQEQGW